jgi:hypothetical protein
MHIEMNVKGDGPPTGTIKRDGDPPRSFEGWLGLLTILGQMLNPLEPARKTAIGQLVKNAPRAKGDDGE